MAKRITTVSVHPDRAAQLRAFRDEHDFPSMDTAMAALFARVGE